MDKIKINIFNIVGDDFFVEAEDGQKLFEKISLFLKQKKKIILSFKNSKIITSSFLNTAIGQLYRDFKHEHIKKSIEIEDLRIVDKLLLKRVIETAKIYYSDPKNLKNSINKILKENE